MPDLDANETDDQADENSGPSHLLPSSRSHDYGDERHQGHDGLLFLSMRVYTRTARVKPCSCLSVLHQNYKTRVGDSSGEDLFQRPRPVYFVDQGYFLCRRKENFTTLPHGRAYLRDIAPAVHKAQSPAKAGHLCLCGPTGSRTPTSSMPWTRSTAEL